VASSCTVAGVVVRGGCAGASGTPASAHSGSGSSCGCRCRHGARACGRLQQLRHRSMEGLHSRCLRLQQVCLCVHEHEVYV
jgi:hypothetical protein